VIDIEALSWSALSEEAAETVREIAVPLSLGLSHGEVAEQLGVPEAVVGRRLRILRRELLRLGVVRRCSCGAEVESGRLCGACQEAARAERKRAAAAP
jgi:hypothetical protein